MLLINKPKGITSHDVVDEVRKITGKRRVGHAGTLDPFATGLLIVLVGREETKRQQEFMKLPKVYEATFILGEERDTDDVTGKVRELAPSLLRRKKNHFPDRKEIESVLKKFEGEIEQVPPVYSAIKIKGKKAYELARKGEVPKLKAKKVTIYSIEILDYKYPAPKGPASLSPAPTRRRGEQGSPNSERIEQPELKIKTRVSSGTYIRSLARDIGRELGTSAYVKELKRTQIGEYQLKDAITLEKLKSL